MVCELSQGHQSPVVRAARPARSRGGWVGDAHEQVLCPRGMKKARVFVYPRAALGIQDAADKAMAGPQRTLMTLSTHTGRKRD